MPRSGGSDLVAPILRRQILSRAHATQPINHALGTAVRHAGDGGTALEHLRISRQQSRGHVHTREGGALQVGSAHRSASVGGRPDNAPMESWFRTLKTTSSTTPT